MAINGNSAGAFMTGFMSGYKFVDDMLTKKQEREAADKKAKLELAIASDKVINEATARTLDFSKQRTEIDKNFTEFSKNTTDQNALLFMFNKTETEKSDLNQKEWEALVAKSKALEGTALKNIITAPMEQPAKFDPYVSIASETGSKYLLMQNTDKDIIANLRGENPNYKIAENGTLMQKDSSGQFVSTNRQLKPATDIAAIKQEKDRAKNQYDTQNLDSLPAAMQEALKPFAINGKVTNGAIDDYSKSIIVQPKDSTEEKNIQAQMAVIKSDPKYQNLSDNALRIMAVEHLKTVTQPSVNEKVFTAFLTEVQNDPKFKGLPISEQTIEANKRWEASKKTDGKPSTTQITFDAALAIARSKYKGLTEPELVLKANEIVALSTETGKINANIQGGIVGSQMASDAITQVLGERPKNLAFVSQAHKVKLQNYFSFQAKKGDKLIDSESSKRLASISSVATTIDTMIQTKGSATGMLDNILNKIGAFTGVGAKVQEIGAYNTARTSLESLIARSLQGGGALSNKDIENAGNSLGNAWNSDRTAMASIQQTLKQQINILENEMSNGLNNPDYMEFTYGKTLNTLKALERAVSFGSGSDRVTKDDVKNKYIPPSQLFGQDKNTSSGKNEPIWKKYIPKK